MNALSGDPCCTMSPAQQVYVQRLPAHLGRGWQRCIGRWKTCGCDGAMAVHRDSCGARSADHDMRAGTASGRRQ